MPPFRTVSDKQLEFLINEAERCNIMATMRPLGPQGSKLTKEKFEQIAETLNAIPNGTEKDAGAWRRFWVEWRSKVKSRFREMKKQARRGYPSKIAPFTAFEQRTLAVMGVVNIASLPSDRDVGAVEELEGGQHKYTARISTDTDNPNVNDWDDPLDDINHTDIAQSQFGAYMQWVEERRSAMEQRRLTMEEKRVQILENLNQSISNIVTELRLIRQELTKPVNNNLLQPKIEE